MKKSRLIEIIKEVLREDGSVTTGVGPTAVPFAWTKEEDKNKKNAATKQGERLGFKTVKKKKRPYSTEMFVYLDEKK